MYTEKYVEGKMISFGTMGKVYKGTNKETQKSVAIKKISKNNEKINREFLEKATKLEVNNMKICKSENSVELYDFYEDDDNYIIIMEFCDGRLLDYLNNRWGFSPEEIYEIFSALNKTFKIMRENNISHRDIKLDNILIKYVDESKTKFIPKICDYGFSKSIIEEGKNTQLGSLKTMAPEVYKIGSSYGPKADLWSIGVILYLCYFKKYPYNDIVEIIKKTELKYEKPNNFFLADLIDKLLVINPDKRISWEEYFNHPFFKYSSLSELDIGFNNNNLKYYKAKYKENEIKYKTVLLKEMKQENLEKNFYKIDYEINKELIKDENILKLMSTEEFKDEKGKQVIYFIYEFDEKCIPLNVYCKNHNFGEKEIQKLINQFFNIFKTYSNKDIFISLYSFIVFPNDEIKLIDFGLHKRFLSDEEKKIYYAPNENEMKKSGNLSKTILMNFGMTILKLINNNEDDIFYKGNKFNLKYKNPISEKLSSFLSKCLCTDIKERANWNNLIYEEQPNNIINDIEDNKNETLLNEKQFEIVLNNLLNKYKSINNYYNMINIDNLDYIYENEDFILLTLYEIEEIKKIVSDENEFNKNIFEISFLTLLMEENTNKILDNKFFIFNSRNCFNSKLISNSLCEGEKNDFINKITKIYDNLLKILLNIKQATNSDKYSLIFNKINDNFLEDFIKGFGNSKFCQFFFSYIHIFNENHKKNNINYKKAYVELNLFKYIAEFLLFFKEVINNNNYKSNYESKEKIIEEMNNIFNGYENEEKKIILVNMLSLKIRNIFNSLSEIDDAKNILEKDNEEAIQKLVNFYPYILKLINYVKEKDN